MYRRETSKLHAMARSPRFRVVVTDHAERRLLERDVSRFEAERLVRAGVVVMVETDPGGGERWRVAGRDTDGRQIEVEVEAVPPALVVLVTVVRVG